MKYLLSIAAMGYTKLYEISEIKELTENAKVLEKVEANVEIYECHPIRHLPNFISDVMSTEVNKG